jgi:hypothetical protein
LRYLFLKFMLFIDRIVLLTAEWFRLKYFNISEKLVYL